MQNMLRKIFLFFILYLLQTNCYAQSNAVNCSPNLNFNLGNFTNWQCYIGKVSTLAPNNIITVTPSLPISNRHLLIKKTAPSLKDYYGQFEITPADGTDYVLKLGNDSIGKQADRATYKLKVPSNLSNFSITYQYAVVLEDPNHKTYEQPRLNVKWIDSATGNILACPSVEFVVSNVLPGFLPSAKYVIKTDTVWYKPWSKVYVNLSAYLGKTIYLEVTTADCALGAHFGYGYFSVLSCGENIVVPTYHCTTPPSIEVIAPPGFQAYNWWDSAYSTIVATGNQTIISPLPSLNSYYNLEIIPYNGYGCRDTIKTKPIYLGKIVANAGPDKTICKGTSLLIGDVAKIHQSYSWLPANNINNPIISAPTVNPLVQQDYYLTVYDSSTFCTGYDTVKVNLFPKPIYNFTVKDSVRCANVDFDFLSTISPSIKSFYWNFYDGTISTANSLKHNYSTPGNYQVAFVVKDTNTCNDSLVKTVTVSSNPATTFAVNAQNQCLRGNSFIFSNTYFTQNGGLRYNWNFGDNTPFSTLANPQHSYNQVGTYILKLYVSDTINCNDSVTVPIEIFKHPKASFTINDSLQCLNINQFSFTNTSRTTNGNLTYHWDFGDGVGNSSATNPAYQYPVYGNKKVTLVATNTNNCSDTTQQPVVIYPTPLIDFTIDTGKLCLTNNKFNFTNLSAVPLDSLVSYYWAFGDGQYANVKATWHSYTQSGLFNVKLLGTTNNGCKDSTQKPITVFAIPQVAITSQGIKNICINDSALITVAALAGSGSISKYDWYNNGVAMLGLKDSFTYVSQAGLYSVIVSNSNGCTNNSSGIPISIYPYPIGNIAAPISYNICEGTSIALSATSGYNYQWYLNGDSIAGSNTKTYLATKEGKYIVRFINNYGCATYATNDIKLRYISKPKSIFSFDKYCINTAIDFYNHSIFTTGDSLQYQWSFGDGISSKLFSPTHNFTLAKDYKVSLNVMSNICHQLQDVSTQTISIVYPIASIRYPSENALMNKPQPLLARDIGTNYLWKPHYYLNDYTVKNPVFTSSREQQYYITILLPNGCSVTDTLLVKMFEDGDIFVPKAFTPNKDGHNDNLYPLIVGTTQLKMFRIFNRWGQLMFETSTPRFGWNGIFNNTPQPMDTYTWTLEATSFDGKPIRRSGNSVLIR